VLEKPLMKRIRADAPGRNGLTDVATLDRRHITVVRPRHVDALTLLP
jgi:hypothetical protein